MNAVEPINVSTPVTKANFISVFVQAVLPSVSLLCSWRHGAKRMWSIEWFYKSLFNFVLMNQ